MSGITYGAPQRITELKAASDGAWEVSGYASTFEQTDLGGDVVHAGAFAESLGSGRPVRFLYAHNPSDVLGTAISLREDERGLFGQWRISKTRLGEDVRTLLKDGALDSFSIGFIPRDADRDEKAGTRHLKSVELLEVSVVAMPMNPWATVTGIKAGDYWGDPYQGLTLEQLLDAYDTQRSAALTRVQAVVGRRLAEGRKLSDATLATLERLRGLAEADAAALLRLATTPPTPAEDEPAPVQTVGLVEAHLRRARLRELGRQYGVTTP